ncbi:MAG: LA2681 family HEPN domain-containing protein [Citrobacter sp.]|uniref:LA2681 family HEPN domain-containing protein n=1 Tax=Citrobacter sp. TaxID=1896336 RepID=UPI002FC9C9C5
MEHRSLKIADDFGYELATSYNNYHNDEFNKQQELVHALLNEINQIGLQLKQAKKDNNTELLDQLQNQIEKLNTQLEKVKSNIDEKERLSSYSLSIPISQFESRLMQLITLARNSIMYLSLAIHFEERKRPKDGLYMPREVPLKQNLE